MAYRPLSHTAEIGFEVSSMDLNKLFVESARAFFREMFGTLYGIRVNKEKRVSFEAEELEELLHRWLSFLLTEFEVNKMVYRQFDVEVDFEGYKFVMSATMGGEKFNPEKHKVIRHFKAVTRHKLHIERERGIWRASVVIDV